MFHLFSSVVKVNELKMTPVNGRMLMRWAPVEGLQYYQCRLDLQFMRPGKDAPVAPTSGVIPDREGIMFGEVTDLLKAGMQIVTIPDPQGNEVVKGVFEIREIPGIALGYSSQHHIEVKVVETVQVITESPDLTVSYDPLSFVTLPPLEGSSDGVVYPYAD